LRGFLNEWELSDKDVEIVRRIVKDTVYEILDEKVWPTFCEFVNAQEAGIVAFKQRLKEAKNLWNPDKIKWEKAEGASGPYERSEDVNNPEFKALLKDLAAHNGRLTREGFFYWTFKNGATIGRKKRADVKAKPAAASAQQEQK
jgi:hypothetical protein